MSDTMGGGWNNPDYGFDTAGALSGFGGLLGGLFGNSGSPYEDAMKQYQDWYNKSQQNSQPYVDAGKQGLGNYQDWLNKQKDPTKFINDLTSQYSESPYAQYLQKQSLHAGQNAASASGLSGSTPLFQQLQQNAGDISSKDQNSWLQNVLGINTQYGQGQNNLVQTGANATNSLNGLNSEMGKQMGEAAYGQRAGRRQDFWNTIGGGLGILGSFL